MNADTRIAHTLEIQDEANVICRFEVVCSFDTNSGAFFVKTTHPMLTTDDEAKATFSKSFRSKESAMAYLYRESLMAMSMFHTQGRKGPLFVIEGVTLEAE